MAKKDLWDKVQIFFIILTPLILGIGGFFINSAQQEISDNISKLEQTVSTVEAMIPYFDMLVGDDTNKAKMAAYALYMLNKEDPEMAVSLILAANRGELIDVLKDLGNRDTLILSIVAKAVTSKEGETEVLDTIKSEIEISAKEIIQSISTKSSGWLYLGNFEGGKWTKRTIKIVKELPKEGDKYTVIDDVYLRDSKPKLPLYKLGKILGVIKVGEEIKIDIVDTDVGRNRVWAKVTVVSR